MPGRETRPLKPPTRWRGVDPMSEQSKSAEAAYLRSQIERASPAQRAWLEGLLARFVEFARTGRTEHDT